MPKQSAPGLHIISRDAFPMFTQPLGLGQHLREAVGDNHGEAAFRLWQRLHTGGFVVSVSDVQLVIAGDAVPVPAEPFIAAAVDCLNLGDGGEEELSYHASADVAALNEHFGPGILHYVVGAPGETEDF